MPFTGLRVLSLESRRAKEMEALIRREGGDPVVAPSVQERALEDDGSVLRFVERIERGEFDLLICMTAAGLTFARDAMAARGEVERLSNALRRVVILSRGPKPLPVLRELGTKAQIVVEEPNTWREIVEAIAARPERRIAVQEYGRPNPEMTTALEALGAVVTPVVVYRWELPDDIGPLQEAARRLAARDIDVALFTSSIQLDHLFLVATGLGIEPQVRDAFKRYTATASVGPVMTSSMNAADVPVDVEPVHPKMMALVRAAAEGAAAAIARKRTN